MTNYFLPEPLRAMLVTDLDGTLLDSSHQLSHANREALEASSREGVLRVVATGRSLYAARRVIDANFPIDFLVYSSGAGTVNWPSGEAFHGQDMVARDFRRAAQALIAAGLDFMIQDRVPHTHRFRYLRNGKVPNPDFDGRVARYVEFARQLDPAGGEPDLDDLPCSHLVAIEPHGQPTQYDELRRALAPLHVVRTTSPLDHRSRWIEIYPPGVGKSFAAERLREAHGVATERVASIGNDFNDEDLLAWAGRGFVVANAREELCQQYTVVAANTQSGVAEALEQLLQDI